MSRKKGVLHKKGQNEAIRIHKENNGNAGYYSWMQEHINFLGMKEEAT